MSHTASLAIQIENAFPTSSRTRRQPPRTRNRLSSNANAKLTGSTFAQLMVFGAASTPCPTYTDWTQAAALAGTLLTPQGIEQRFTPQAAHFLYALLQRFVGRVITLCTPAVAPLLQRFAGVYIKDSTVISLPQALASLWQGAGGSAGATAAVKLQVRWKLWHGAAGRTDPAACPLPRPRHAVWHRRLACGELGAGGLGVL
jgi:hypothetical protein